jgi:hypothetical protein
LPAPEPVPDDEATDPGGIGEITEDDETPATVVPGTSPSEDFEMSRPTLARGTTDKDAAIELQTLLNKNGEKLGVDGDFGPGTERAVKGFQESYGLPVDGVAGAAVWAILDRASYGTDPAYKGVPLPPSSSVSGSSGVAKAWNAYGNLLGLLATSLDIDPSVACAVLAVESAGEGFWDGKMVIRFENHIFHRFWGKTHQGAFDEHFQMDGSKRWTNHKWRTDPSEPWRDLHTGKSAQGEEWKVLEFARTLNDTAALNSISMGAPQIMGFNSEKVGFATVQDMFEAFSTDERAHVLGLFDFIRSDHKMVRALRAGDTTSFAGIYNGPGQKDYYGEKIAENAAAAKKLGIP